MKIDTRILARKCPNQGRLFQQFKEYIKGAIRHGFYKPGDPIESDRQFMAAGMLSYPTVSRAFRELAKEGWLVRKVGSGTFINAQLPVVKSRIKRLAVMYYRTDTPYYESIFRGVDSECRKHGITPARIASSDFKGDEHDAVRYIIKNKMDGVLGLSTGSFALMQDLVAINSKGFPMVLLGMYFEQVPCDAVILDAEEYGRESTRHLLELGHHRLLFVGSIPCYPFSMRHADMLRGIRIQLAEAGMPLASLEELHLAAGFDENDTRLHASVLRALRRDEKDCPTGILCESDGYARYLYSVFSKADIRIPDDVSVVGFGELTSVLKLKPQLTSAAWPMHKLGEHAVRLIVSQSLNTKRSTMRIILEAPLHARGSTGPAKLK